MSDHHPSQRIVAAERIAPGLPVTFDAAGRVIRWEPVPPIHFADEALEPGDVLTVMPDGAVRLADRAQAARRAAVERAIERHAPPDDDAPPPAAGDGSPAPGGDGEVNIPPNGTCHRKDVPVACSVLSEDAKWTGKSA